MSMHGIVRNVLRCNDFLAIYYALINFLQALKSRYAAYI